ncbi:ATP-dependent helicase, C-terminal [Dillenia turbinata]|uniref:ATP-dependent helicase, C-terminal n=1 Tax=Dillenia turbinata TaxID=194707 RepID=A0AAN8URX8_9MAGN
MPDLLKLKTLSLLKEVSSVITVQKLAIEQMILAKEGVKPQTVPHEAHAIIDDLKDVQQAVRQRLLETTTKYKEAADCQQLFDGAGMTCRTMSWWCFNPGIAMEEFSRLNVGSIILTSGTLSPMDSFAQELKLEFPVRLENPHVISSNQLWAGVVTSGPSGHSFNSSYWNRDSMEYKQELGNAIVNLARIVPDGLLVFFPSYYVLDKCIGCWKDMSQTNSTNSPTIWERICRHKQPVIEPRQSSLFASSIDDYMTKLMDASTSGAVYFAVFRGKVSEGLDFADHAGRAVVVTGIPFATKTDPKVKTGRGMRVLRHERENVQVRLKREYLDQQAQLQSKGCKFLTGEEWYTQQALRAVNQAVGRVIRHRHDYGAILFFDERFANLNRQAQISRWIQPHLKCYTKFGEVVFTLTRFFRDGVHGSDMPKMIQTEFSALNSCSVPKEVKHKKTVLDDAPSSSDSLHLTHGKKLEGNPSEALERSYLENFLSSQMPTLDQHDSFKSLSRVLEVKRADSSSPLAEIIPANRSFLTPYKQKNQALTLNCSSDALCNKRKLLILERDTNKPQNCEMIDLTINPSNNVYLNNYEMALPCSSKRPRKLTEELDAMCHSNGSRENLYVIEKSETCCNSVTINLSQPEKLSMNINAPDMRVSSAAACEKVDIQEMASVSVNQTENGILSSPVPCKDEETRGSAFLIQVQEKLSAAEYKSFVGFMKALKTKAMTTGHVLQSIVELFSGPERHPLLRRFRDYIPAKYRYLYEQHIKAHSEAAGTKAG